MLRAGSRQLCLTHEPVDGSVLLRTLGATACFLETRATQPHLAPTPCLERITLFSFSSVLLRLRWQNPELNRKHPSVSEIISSLLSSLREAGCVSAQGCMSNLSNTHKATHLFNLLQAHSHLKIRVRTFTDCFCHLTFSSHIHSSTLPPGTHRHRCNHKWLCHHTHIHTHHTHTHAPVHDCMWQMLVFS